MSRQLTLSEITDTGKAVQIGQLQTGEIVVGRSPEATVSLPSDAVSYEHGVFARMRNHWFFKDLGSTNGSWINGEKVPPERWRVVRSGDVLQVGDRVLRIEAEGGLVSSGFPALGGRALLIFKNGELIDEFPVPDVGVALIVGGARGDLDFPQSNSSSPILVIEKGIAGLDVRSETGLNIVFKNAEEVTLPTLMVDRDEILIGEYVIVCNDPFWRVNSDPQHGLAVKSGDAGFVGTLTGHTPAPDWDSDDLRHDEGPFRRSGPGFGELSSIGQYDSGSQGAGVPPLVDRVMGTRAGGAGRPLAQDAFAYMPPPPPPKPGFFATPEGRLVKLSFFALLAFAIAVGVLLFAK